MKNRYLVQNPDTHPPSSSASRGRFTHSVQQYSLVPRRSDWESESEMPTLTKLYSMKEAALHNTPDDCWIVVDGKVAPPLAPPSYPSLPIWLQQ